MANEKPKQESKRKGVLAKIAHLGEILHNMEWNKDGINAHQKYKYISEAQYKTNHGKACVEAGLIFKFQVAETELIDMGEDRQVVEIRCEIEYIDPETGEREKYTTFAHGADTGMKDKAIYKAETGAYKYHIANNFHISENNDVEKDDSSAASKPKRKTAFQSSKHVAEAKSKLITGDKPSKEQLAEFEKVFAEYKKVNPKKAEAFLKSNDPSKLNANKMKSIIVGLKQALGGK